ncbi:MAG: recombinase family protein [Lachnospiraceae bacterium]|nr:recombinase family protein [Lachnospiraceae bacterium]MDD6170311.1 recombinase family protein [Lachnospiraceae bacterium]MDY4838108.1 recombinase family protein [Lachnospiraceae bacterium]
MRAVISDWQPRNRITTPLAGSPSYINSGIIKTVMKSGEKISVAQIDYQEFDEENFQYVIRPYWEIIDGLPTSVFQGIPGIDMDLRLERYYRVNYIPTFIAERTPSENREDLWDILESVGLDYYDRFEWLLRTTMRSANDNLIVERRRTSQVVEKFTSGILSTLQYGDRIIVDSMESIADTTAGFVDGIFTVITNGVDIIDQSGQILVDTMTRAAMVPIVVTQRIIARREHALHRRTGIEQAKKEGKYTGRKPIEVDEKVLRQVNQELKAGLITVEEAMKRTKIASKSTFYRKVRALNRRSTYEN